MTDELSPQEQEAIVVGLLDQILGPGSMEIGPVLDMAALGLVNGTWRNSPVEDWHAEGKLTDGDMLRVNSHSTWRVRELVRRWRRSAGLRADEPVGVLDDLPIDDVAVLAQRLFVWFTNPDRQLVTGTTLRNLAPTELHEWAEHAENSLDGVIAMAEDYGSGFAMRRVAVHGAMACRGWWGSPTWPDQVRRFVEALDSPQHEHWSAGRYDEIMSAEPAAAADRAVLRRTLVARPWETPAAVAGWVVRAGIGFFVAPLPAPQPR